MTVRLDPGLFLRGQWNIGDAESMNKFQTFSGFFLRNLRHHPNDIQQSELESFLKLATDPTLLPYVHHQIQWLQQDVEMASVVAHPAINYFLTKTQHLSAPRPLHLSHTKNATVAQDSTPKAVDAMPSLAQQQQTAPPVTAPGQSNKENLSTESHANFDEAAFWDSLGR